MIRGLPMISTHGISAVTLWIIQEQVVLGIAMELPATTVDLPEQTRIQEEVLVLVAALCRKSQK